MISLENSATRHRIGCFWEGRPNSESLLYRHLRYTVIEGVSTYVVQIVHSVWSMYCNFLFEVYANDCFRIKSRFFLRLLFVCNTSWYYIKVKECCIVVISKSLFINNFDALKVTLWAKSSTWTNWMIFSNFLEPKFEIFENLRINLTTCYWHRGLIF